jgi:CubicO group peptidase (beta-lactamase class C family)
MRSRSLVTFLLAAQASLTLAAGNPAEIARSFMQRNGVPGLAYAVMINGSVVSYGAYGVSDLTTKEKITPDSTFPIASLSKPFVAMGVLSLVEKGSLKIDDPVGKYLPELPDDWKSIPIVRLLDHTAGVPDHINSGAFNWTDPAPIGSDELIKRLITLPLRFKSGDRYEYSNGNYVLLAKVIERVSGQPYERFLAEKIFQPLGMKHTLALTANDLPNAVHGYRKGNDGPTPLSFNPDWCYGNGALGSSILDLARLDAALYTQKILRISTLSYITTPHPLNDGKLANYAMGWAIGKLRGARAINHSGRVGGWQSFFARFADLNATVVVVANNGDANLSTVATDLAGTVLPSLALQPIPDAYPALTRAHEEFIGSIVSGEVDPTRLSDGLRRDYGSKGHWSGIADALRQGGPFTLFAPTDRRQTGPDSFTSSYRLEQGDRVWKIELGWNGAGVMDKLMVTGF